MDKPRSVVIVGAGVIGIASAYALARRGMGVTVVDSASGAGMGASRANGAQLSYKYTDALANPRILKDLPRLSLGFDPGFRMHCNLDWQYVSWLGRFLMNCTSRKFEQHTMAGLALAQKSHLAMQNLLKEHKIEMHHETNGKLHLYNCGRSFRQAVQIVNWKNGAGGCQEILAPDAVAEIEPALKDAGQNFAGAIHTPDEQVADPLLFCREMSRILTSQYGVDFRFGSKVDKVKPGTNGAVAELENGDPLQSDMVAICAASQSNRILQPLKLSVPIVPMKGYSFEMPLSNGSPKKSITDVKRRIVFTNLGDRMRVAGLADLGDGTQDIREQRMKALVDLAKQSLPNAGRYELAERYWAGLRPMTPNSLPIISNPLPGLAINTGHGMLGWTMAMGSGERLAEMLLSD